MKISEAEILILPGLGGGNEDYWYSRWETKLKSAKRVKQADWNVPDFEAWTQQVTIAVEQAEKPVVLVAHSLGVMLAVHASPRFPHQKVAGGYFVAPPDMSTLVEDYPETAKFAPAPTSPLSYPSVLVASTNDPYCAFEVAEDLSYAWGSKFENAGESGHINSQSGQGPWPEGLLSFANFMSTL